MNDRLVTEIRRAMAELANATPPTPPLDDLLAARSAPRPPHRPRPLTFAAVAVSLAVAVAGLVFVRSRVDHESRTDEAPSTTVAPVNTTTATTTPATTTASTTTSTPQTTVEAATTAAAPTTLGPPDGALVSGFEPASITWISLQQGWLLGNAPCAAGTCISLARTRDGGQTWHGVPAPSIAADAVDGVRFASAADGWLFGATAWSTHDGGTTWRQVPGLTGVTRLEVAAGRAYAIVSGDSDTAKVFTAPPARDTWSLVEPTSVINNDLALRGSIGYVIGTDGLVRAVSPAGLTTLGQPCADGESSGAGGLAIADNTTVAVLCAGDAAMGSGAKHLKVSTDGGKTFAPAGDAPLGGTQTWLTAASATTYVVGASSGATYLYRSTDGGATWQTVFEEGNGGAQLVDLGFTDAKHGVVVMNGYPTPVLLTTSDGGATWTKVAVHD